LILLILSRGLLRINRYSLCHLFTMLRQRLLSAIDLLILVHFISEASEVGEHMEAFFFKEIPQYRGNNKGGVHAFLLNTRGCWHSLGQNGWAWLGCIREGGYTGHSLFHDSLEGSGFPFLSVCRSLETLEYPFCFWMSCIQFLRGPGPSHYILFSIVCFAATQPPPSVVSPVQAFYFVGMSKH